MYYPGRKEDPGHAVASRQQIGFGGIVSFELDTGQVCIKTSAKGLDYFSLAESLDGVERLICHPSTMTHVTLSQPAKANASISERLIRLSVGIEDGDDL
ncbi:MAG: PLP-dependent transferase [Pseudomonadota bacterium]